MRFPCQLSQQPDGTWRAVHDGAEVGRVEAMAGSRDDVIDKLKGEIRYRLELCPCSGETYQHINVDVESGDASSSP